MKWLFYHVAGLEFWAAIRLAALGDWWAEWALFRREKNSGKNSSAHQEEKM